MFDKAATLVSNQSHIWKMPTNSDSRPIFMFPSTSSENAHKVVVFPECCKVACNQACVNWCTHSLCSHTVAVAETMKRLKEFLNWFKKQKHSPNLTSLANINMPQNKGRKCGTRKRKGSSNKKPTEGLPVVSSRVIQSQLRQVNQLMVQPTKPEESDIVSRHDQPRFPPTNAAFQRCMIPTNNIFHCGLTPTTSTFQPDMTPTISAFQPGMTQKTSAFQPGTTPTISAFQPGTTPTTSTFQRGMTPTYIRHDQRSPIDPIIYQTQKFSPARQKPDFGSFAFARLPYLDSRVSKCYGCGELLKPGGVLPPQPNDLVVTTRLHRKYPKDGQLQISPTISSVYLHVSSYCARAALPDFTPALCYLPNDLAPFLYKEHHDLMHAKLGLRFAQN